MHMSKPFYMNTSKQSTEHEALQARTRSQSCTSAAEGDESEALLRGHGSPWIPRRYQPRDDADHGCTRGEYSLHR